MIKLTDQIGQTLFLENPPQRIVSLVPSQTELLYDLGLGDRVVGLTKFCIHPKTWRKTKAVVGGTKNIHHTKVAALNPDLIIANKEENTKEDILKLQENYPVYTSDIFTIDESFKMMQNIGTLCQKETDVQKLILEIKNSFKLLENSHNKTVAYVIWQNPIMLAGQNTFIQNMLALAGFKNAMTDVKSRYPEVSLAELKSLNPDLIFLSSEPFPFKEKHKVEFEKTTGIKTILADGEMFSWYGSRMLKFVPYLKSLHF